MGKLIAIIFDRYEIYSDGTIYDNCKAEDIPEFIFQIRDILLEEVNHD